MFFFFFFHGGFLIRVPSHDHDARARGGGGRERQEQKKKKIADRKEEDSALRVYIIHIRVIKNRLTSRSVGSRPLASYSPLVSILLQERNQRPAHSFGPPGASKLLTNQQNNITHITVSVACLLGFGDIYFFFLVFFFGRKIKVRRPCAAAVAAVAPCRRLRAFHSDDGPLSFFLSSSSSYVCSCFGSSATSFDGHQFFRNGVASRQRQILAAAD